jgi:hypothetical protein
VNYEPVDVHRLVALPYHQLMRPSSALVILRRQAEAIDRWGDFLPRYRSILCEPLDFAYKYLCCLGALDTLLLHDLVTEFSWRAIVMGAWLAALEPRPAFRELLLEARPRAPRNDWVVDLAVAAIDGTRPQPLAEHLGLMARIRQALAPIPRPTIRLARRDHSELELIQRDAETVRSIYRARGCDAVVRYLAVHPWRTRLPSSSDQSRPQDGQVWGEPNPPWFWGVHPPFTTDDLMSWKPGKCSPMS